ncbi:molybdenum cofactor guanylyltransferase [Phenylobacterium sp. LH3H17]|uniref:molybdenum cofactor guanylyltransferase n=1 Tax=Phenylobacterium sp. LH3H17 TaxID=2903901 RepID=UPI0020C9EAF5|nr:molybdenum cofactor guanylyltransferase [Phenylobacterium sp. LH3H17]UTP38758.1 molybdenum cofactor guanylyltransferase [Phenylobacterium sp. LH3H17]
MQNRQAVGLVIAGGRSQRFGGEKAVAMLGGRSLLARACARLAADCTVVAVNARGEGAAEAGRLGVPALDDPPGLASGPLSGVLAGLRWARERGARLMITLPCDTPLLPDDLVARLIAAAQGRRCAVARSPDGLQSLCAAWSVDLIGDLEAALADGRHPPVHGFLEDHDCGLVDYADAAAFLNLNTPQDLAEAERRLGA